MEAALGEISYALEKRWGKHVPSSPVILVLYITSFCGGRGDRYNKGGGKNSDDGNDDDHDEEEDEE